jgi:hypothetical protein
MSFTDLTTEYATRHLIEFETLEQLAQNDYYNRLPNGTATLFFQAAAPAKWTKATSHNNKCFRVVSGAGGGNGGTQGLGSAITLAHSHTVDSHTHDSVAHQHPLHLNAESNTGVASGLAVMSADTDGASMYMRIAGAGASTNRVMKAQTTSAGGSLTLGATAPGTDSQLSNQTFAYFDAIICVKD